MFFSPYKENILSKIIYIFFIIFMIGIVILKIFKGQFMHTFIGSLVILGLFSLELIINKLNVIFPWIFRVGISVFLFCTIYLGEMRRFYDKFWWWDLAIHFYSGFLGVLLAIFIIGVANAKLRKTYIYNPVIIIAICLFISISFEGFWEVFEFVGDKVFNTNMGKSGLQDAMTDFIMNILGSIICGVLVYFKKEVIIKDIFKFSFKS